MIFWNLNYLARWNVNNAWVNGMCKFVLDLPVITGKECCDQTSGQCYRTERILLSNEFSSVDSDGAEILRFTVKKPENVMEVISKISSNLNCDKFGQHSVERKCECISVPYFAIRGHKRSLLCTQFGYTSSTEISCVIETRTYTALPYWRVLMYLLPYINEILKWSNFKKPLPYISDR